jgi:hypothetical protein
LRASSASTANAFGLQRHLRAGHEQAPAGQVDLDLFEHDPAGCRLVFCHALSCRIESADSCNTSSNQRLAKSVRAT